MRLSGCVLQYKFEALVALTHTHCSLRNSLAALRIHTLALARHPVPDCSLSPRDVDVSRHGGPHERAPADVCSVHGA